MQAIGDGDNPPPVDNTIDNYTDFVECAFGRGFGQPLLNNHADSLAPPGPESNAPGGIDIMPHNTDGPTIEDCPDCMPCDPEVEDCGGPGPPPPPNPCEGNPDPCCGSTDPCCPINCPECETCVNGNCVPIDCGGCDDGDPCTDDTCVCGVCEHTPIDCDDGDVCTDDSCDPVLGCVNTHIPGCVDTDGDGIPDDVDTDDDNDGILDVDENPGCRTNPDPCCGVICPDCETCENGGCIAMDCDDSNVCTSDSCAGGNCVNTQIPGCVDTDGDGIPDSVDTDDDGDGIPDDQENPGCRTNPNPCCGVICPDCETCENGNCVPMDCNDDNPCTDDSCVGGGCVNTLKDCDDGIPCTEDSCDMTTGLCSHVLMTCDDTNACTNDSCVNGNCVNTPINCDDGDPCTNDSCVNGNCVNTIVCPTLEIISVPGNTACGMHYGAAFTLFFSCNGGPVTNWWIREVITFNMDMGPPQIPSCIDQSAGVIIAPDRNFTNWIPDAVVNWNGPPTNVAPCLCEDDQTLFVGPTQADIMHCQYSNIQVISVMLNDPPFVGGTVTTTSGGDSISCDF